MCQLFDFKTLDVQSFLVLFVSRYVRASAGYFWNRAVGYYEYIMNYHI